MEQPGFQTASANDTDNQETNTGDGMRIESNRDAGLEVSPTAGDGRSVGGQIVSKPQMEGQAYVEPACINNNNNNNSSRDSKPDESVSEKSDEQAGRRMSDTGAERANKWRLNRARRGDRSRAQAEEFRANSISQLTSDIETSANNDDDENNRSTEQQQQQQQGAGSVNVEHKETSRYLASQSITDNSTNWRLPTALRPPPDIRIHVDTCEDLLESFPPHYQLSSVNENEPIRLEHHEFVSSFLQAFDQPPIAPPPTRSSSSVDLTTLSGGYDTTRDNRLGSTSCWGDQSLVSSRSVSNMLTSSEQDLLLLSVQTQDAGSLSDGAYKLTKYRRPNQRAGAGAGGELLASGLQHNKRRFENWKRNNKLMTNAHDNPFNLYMDCLERLDALNTTTTTKSDLTRQASNGKSVREQTTQTMESEEQPQQQQQQQRQPNDLSNYANNLTHLYRKNRESMDSSHDFRTLLYDIICCLLVQDEQVLSTVSVGKMLDVIRTHLDTASRVYAETSNQLLSNLAQQLSNQQQNDQRTAATSSSSSSSSGVSVETLAASSLLPCRQQQTAIGVYQVPIDGSGNEDKRVTEREESTTMLANDQIELASLQEPRIGCTRNHQHHQKPADFRRISSVSFNDEQLINDLRDQHRTEAVVRRSDSLSNDSSNSQRNEPAYSPSPWAYRELSDRRQSGPNTSSKLDSAGSSTSHTTTAHYTSQSSLEQTINNSDHNGHHNDPMNDSGNGTMCDSQAVVSDGFVGYSNEHQVRCRGRRGSLRSADRTVSLCSESFAMISMPKTRINFRKERRLSDFRPMQQPSYMSTDDYLSTTNNNNHNQNNNYHQCTSFYDDDNNSSTLQKCDMAYSHRHHLTTDESLDNDNDDCPPPIDVAGRRAELEWTLNKLINIELKLTWLTSKETLRRAIRKIGVPNEIRGKVWLILIDQMIGTKYDIPKLIELARQTIEQVNEKVVHFDDETQAILKQIELDVNRTMPGHRLFDDGAEGGVKLRRILVAYSIHVNRAIAYCQGFNFIVALLLSVFEGDEMNALRGFICIVDHIFPSKYYFDHYLTGARADQFLLADFICDQLIKSPTMAERKMVEGVTSSITLNWFISLFHGAVPTLTRLTILDHFMLEGVKALFRFTMAILYLAFQVTPPSSCDIFTTIRNTAKDLYDIKLLLSIVDQIKLPKDSYFAIRRSFYMVQSSFNSDQFYMQTLSNEAGKRLMANKPLSCQQLACATKPPALSLISSASFLASATNSFCNHHQQQDQQLASLAGGGGVGNQFALKSSLCHDPIQKPRTRISSDRTKICIQSIGKLGRSHLRIIDANARSNERSLMSPLRNCTLIGITNCGRNLIIARQSAKRNFRSFRVQDLTFHVHEISTEIFDGFYLEETQQALIITHPGEIFKIDCRKCLEDSKLAAPNYLDNCTETLLLRDSGSGSGRDCEKVKLRLATMDSLTNLLWIYVEYEGALGEMSPRLTTGTSDQVRLAARENRTDGRLSDTSIKSTTIMPKTTTRFRFNNPFMDDLDATKMPNTGSDTNNRHNTDDVAYDMDQSNNNNNMKQKRPRSKCDNHHQAVLANKPSFLRKIIIVDIITFDLFSVFAVHPNFGEITNLRASLVAFCQLSNPMSNQFSTRIVQIGPTGRYEQLLSFSDVADYMVNLPDSFKKKYQKQSGKMSNDKEDRSNQQQRYSSLKRFLTHSISFSSIRATSPSDTRQSDNELSSADEKNVQNTTSGTTNNTLTRYYRSLMKSYSSSGPDLPDSRCSTTRDAGEINKFQKKANLSPTSGSSLPCDRKLVKSKKQVPKLIQDGALRSIIASSFGDFSELSETNYIPVNMAFIFRNGKIALFEFTESYAIHTREAQLDRYDYSRVVDVAKNGEDFIVTILTVCDKLIKVII